MAEKKLPERTCAVCRAHLPKDRLIRVVKTKDGKFFVDRTGKADGRGVYVCRDKACLERAVKSRVFSKVFRRETPAELYEELKKALEPEN